MLTESLSDDSDVKEILFLTYTFDVGYFERTALGVAHALGARVTVIADVDMVNFDPYLVRRAGRGYVSALAACAGAFHPKLCVLLGDETVVIAIGSGNVTMSGWQYNEELWTVLRYEFGAADAVPREVAHFLQGLPRFMRLGRGAEAALQRVAAGLSRFEPDNSGDVEVVSSLRRPIIEQLPDGPLDSLSIAAPFHDPSAAAIRELCDRLQPRRVAIGVQPLLTVYDGKALERVADEVGAEVVELDETRYRHGKLFEAKVGRSYWTLTGSPNCSTAALMRAVSRGGNCELGLITKQMTSLMPEGIEFPRVKLRAKQYERRESSGSVLSLLGAGRVEDGLEVELARPVDFDVDIQLSSVAASPDTWEKIGVIPAKEVVTVIARGVEGGARVRVVGCQDGVSVESNLVSVLDPVIATRRPLQAGIASKSDYGVDDLFSDRALAERFFADLEGLKASVVRPPVNVSAATKTASGDNEKAIAYTDWQDYLDECAGRIGHSLLGFAIGLPSLGLTSLATEDGASAPWREDLADDSDAGLDEDADAADHGQEVIQARLPSLHEQSEYVRRRYRQWATRLSEKPGLAPPERMLVLRLVLWIAASGAWEDNEWVNVVARSLAKVIEEVDTPEQLEPAVASLAAVSLAVLSTEAPRSRITIQRRTFEASCKKAEPILHLVEERYVEEYSKLLDTAFGQLLTAPAILDLVESLRSPDPIEEAVVGLIEEHEYFDAHAHDRLMHIPGDFSNPLLPALQAVGMAEEISPVGAWCGNESRWVLVLWDKPNLGVVTGGARRFWSHYRLTGSYSPHLCAYDREIDARFRVAASTGPRDNPGPALVALLEAVGRQNWEPPNC